MNKNAIDLTHFCQTLFILTFIFTALAPVHAALSYETGFESPTFTAGSISGQDGWGGNEGDIQSVVVKSGDQALL